VLGDNIFYGRILPPASIRATLKDGATVFAYPVEDPHRYGVWNSTRRTRNKPGREAQSAEVALRGYRLYFYDNDVVSIASSLKPSARGNWRLPTSTENILSWEAERGDHEPRHGVAGHGTHESLLEAGLFVHTIERRQD